LALLFIPNIQGVAEKPDGFQNEMTQRGLNFLCKSCYHWKTQYMPF